MASEVSVVCGGDAETLRAALAAGVAGRPDGIFLASVPEGDRRCVLVALAAGAHDWITGCRGADGAELDEALRRHRGAAPAGCRTAGVTGLERSARPAVLLDRRGTVVGRNRAWSHGRSDASPWSDCEVGANVLELCARMEGEAEERALRFGLGVAEVITGRRTSFHGDYVVDTDEGPVHLLVRVRSVGDGHVVLTLVDISALGEAEATAARTLRDPGLGRLTGWMSASGGIHLMQRTSAQPAEDDPVGGFALLRRVHRGDRSRLLGAMRRVRRDHLAMCDVRVRAPGGCSCLVVKRRWGCRGVGRARRGSGSSTWRG